MAVPRLSLPALLRQATSPRYNVGASSSRYLSSASTSAASTSASASTSAPTASSAPSTSDAAAAPSSSSAAGSETPSAYSAGIPPFESTPRTVQYPYFVPRVGKTGDSLPVYTDSKNGGTRCLTVIRRIQGNVEALRQDLLAVLQLTYSSAAPPSTKAQKPRAGRKMGPKAGRPTAAAPVQPTKVAGAGKLVVYGSKVQEVKAFLEERGF